ncbi:Folate-biopterin transporter 1 protein [Thalictrum thalictroides]|uniref:Folate-biopterin transporter 1 protein n=1 Tax=Thalictrum thalictroides TaxID=46969 RepID=A0A7J6WIE1_THATH|nr:Folate-biopterin transporter 1 protein [Thalictrum thalictroides]
MEDDDERLPLDGKALEEKEEKPQKGFYFIRAPMEWFKMLAKEMHWSFVLGVVVVYGINQGLGGGLGRVGTDYYWKDVQKVQPSEAQVYTGITKIPWIVKPLWGLLTDVIAIAGYRRRPYFILAGFVGAISMLLISVHSKLHVVFALLSFTAGSAGAAIADVTIDACVAQNSISHPSLAADMQSLCGLSSSIGQLVGFSISGFLVHLIGSKGVFGLLSIPFGLVLFIGMVLKEPYIPNFSYRHVYPKILDASKSMVTTLKCPEVWRPCVYMYLSLALSLNIHEGMFYWYTDPMAGPAFSQENIGFMLSIGSVGSLLGVLLYQNVLKDHPFRGLLFWAQLLYGVAGMLDLILVLRLNLKFGIPDYVFAVIDESVSQMIGRLKWMPLLVLSSKLCPPGIEGTFFALLMSIDNIGLLTSSWGGGFLLHALKINRTQFDNLWLAIFIRNIMRVSPLFLLFLIPRGDPSLSILPAEMLMTKDAAETTEVEKIELVSLVNNT